MSKQLKITAAELTVFLDDGSKIKVPVTSTMLEACVDACGLVIHDLGGGKLASYRFDDETIRENIIPLLPKGH